VKYCLPVILLLMLKSAAIARPDHIVLGYVPSRLDAISSPDDFNYDAFTHLARAFIREQDDGTLTVPKGYFNESFEKAARAHGVKLLMSIGGGSSEADHWPALAHDPRHVQTFFDGVAKLLAEHQYDGIDIDWEPPPKRDDDGRDYTAFLKSLRARFPNILITLAMNATKTATAHFAMEDVVASVDYINAMTYSYATPSSGLATFNENLHADPDGAHTRHSVDDGMANLLETRHVPPTKLLLGINFWACRFRVDQLGDKFPPREKGYADNLIYPEVLDLLSTGKYTAMHDDVADASYLVRKGGGCVITYDDPVSVRDKCLDVLKLKCAGVIIWNVGADLAGGETPLLSAIDESFGMPKLPLSRSALEREITRLSDRPVLTNETLESLLKLDAQLRSARGTIDDEKWMSASPAAK
jgi:chitinase